VSDVSDSLKRNDDAANTSNSDKPVSQIGVSSGGDGSMKSTGRAAVSKSPIKSVSKTDISSGVVNPRCNGWIAMSDPNTRQNRCFFRSRYRRKWNELSKDEHIQISFKGLKRLVLEAVTFGSFLWDVESHVDSRYHFVLNGIYKLHLENMVANFLFGKELWPREEKSEQKNQLGSEGRCNQENCLSLTSINSTNYSVMKRAIDEDCRGVIAKMSRIKTAARQVVRFWRTFADGLMLKPFMGQEPKMTSNRGVWLVPDSGRTDIFLAGSSDHGTFFVFGSLKTLLSYGCRAVKFKTAESMFPSADRSSKEEQENDRNRSFMVQSTTDLDLRRLFLNA
ncbi:LOW QUALITY PROTEIN: hypothetical protein HID58_032866, partial [Brassica napus]